MTLPPAPVVKVLEQVEFTARCPLCAQDCLWLGQMVSVRHPDSNLPVSVSQAVVMCGCAFEQQAAA